MKRAWRMEVRWRDAKMDNGGWEPIRDHMRGRRGEPCCSVGLLLADDKTGITLASSVHGDKAAGVVHIPAGMIVSRRRLRGRSR
jgi:hypothetical protein